MLLCLIHQVALIPGSFSGLAHPTQIRGQQDFFHCFCVISASLGGAHTNVVVGYPDTS